EQGGVIGGKAGKKGMRGSEGRGAGPPQRRSPMSTPAPRAGRSAAESAWPQAADGAAAGTPDPGLLPTEGTPDPGHSPRTAQTPDSGRPPRPARTPDSGRSPRPARRPGSGGR